MKGKPSTLTVCYVFSGKSVPDDHSLPAAVWLPTSGLHKRRDLQESQTMKFQQHHPISYTISISTFRIKYSVLNDKLPS